MSKRPISSSAQASSSVEHLHRRLPLLDDVQTAAAALSADLTAALDEWLGDLPLSFRPAMARAFQRVLVLAKREHKRVLIFDDALPGFTMILMKKEPQAATWKPTGAEPVLASTQSPEAQAAAVLIDRFVQRTHHRVIVVESEDALFAFFPAADLQKNLRELDVFLEG